MKKYAALILALVLAVMLFAGCTKEAEPDTPDTPDITEDEANDPAPAPDEGGEEGGTDAETVPADPEDPAFGVTEDGSDESSVPAEDLFETAFALIDHPVAELYSAIGEPADSSYASSCIGAGQDGELYYDGFVVCTYVENGEETVVDVYK